MSKLAHLLKSHALTIATAESLTAGLVQSKLASESGSSTYFEGGLTAYNIDQKVELLGVDGTHAHIVNCVSDTVAMQMAQGVRRKFGTDIGIATTGYAEACPGERVENPFAWIAVSIGDDFIVARKIEGDALAEPRNEFRERIATAVLNWTYQIAIKEFGP